MSRYLVGLVWIVGLVACGSTTQGIDGTSCTVAESDDGTVTIACEDGTSATVANGAGGEAGPTGPPGIQGNTGPEGDACSVEQLDEYVARVFCEDGTEVVIDLTPAVAVRTKLVDGTSLDGPYTEHVVDSSSPGIQSISTGYFSEKLNVPPEWFSLGDLEKVELCLFLEYGDSSLLCVEELGVLVTCPQLEGPDNCKDVTAEIEYTSPTQFLIPNGYETIYLDTDGNRSIRSEIFGAYALTFVDYSP